MKGYSFNSFISGFSALKGKVTNHVLSQELLPRSLHFIFHLLMTTILWNKENYFHFINWGKWGLEKINYPEPGVKLKNKSLILFFGKNKGKLGLSLAKYVPSRKEFLEMRMNSIMLSLVLGVDIIIYSMLTLRFILPPDLDKSLTVCSKVPKA